MIGRPAEDPPPHRFYAIRYLFIYLLHIHMLSTLELISCKSNTPLQLFDGYFLVPLLIQSGVKMQANQDQAVLLGFLL